jgi:hypothetical protein
MRPQSPYGTDHPVDLNRNGAPRVVMPGIDCSPTSSRHATKTAGGALPGWCAVTLASRNTDAERRMTVSSPLPVVFLVVMTALMTLLMPEPASAAGHKIIATRIAFCPDDDGSNGAVAASVQYPSLLTSYAATVKQLGCKVAGVDYAVGIATGQVLTDWKSVTASGTSLDTSDLRVSGNNVTLNGIDFSTHGGANLYAPDATGTLTITNSNFACPVSGGSSYAVQVGRDVPTLNLVLKNNTFVGDNCVNQSAFIAYYPSSGSLTMQYNYFKHGWQHVLEAGGQTIDYRYNLIEDMTIGASQHMNFLQVGGTVGTVTLEHNTSYEHTVFQPGEGFQIYNGGGGTMSFKNIVARYNTSLALLASGQPTMSYVYHGLCHSPGDCSSTTATVSGSCNIDHNYGDVTGASGLFYSSGGAAGMWGACTLANNTNMVTGAAFSNTP